MSFQKSVIKLGNFQIEKSLDTSSELMYNNVIELAENMIISGIEVFTTHNISLIFPAVLTKW